MKKIVLAIVLILLFIIPSETLAQSIVSGFVYEDSNKNNRKERSEKGIPNVAVSNGTKVVK